MIAINKANAMKRAKEREVPQNVRDAQKRQPLLVGLKIKVKTNTPLKIKNYH